MPPGRIVDTLALLYSNSPFATILSICAHAASIFWLLLMSDMSIRPSFAVGYCSPRAAVAASGSDIAPVSTPKLCSVSSSNSWTFSISCLTFFSCESSNNPIPPNKTTTALRREIPAIFLKLLARFSLFSNSSVSSSLRPTILWRISTASSSSFEFSNSSRIIRFTCSLVNPCFIIIPPIANLAISSYLDR